MKSIAKHPFSSVSLALVILSLLFYLGVLINLLVAQNLAIPVQIANRIVLTLHVLALGFLFIGRQGAASQNKKRLTRSVLIFIAIFWFWTLVVLTIVGWMTFGLFPVF